MHVWTKLCEVNNNAFCVFVGDANDAGANIFLFRYESSRIHCYQVAGGSLNLSAYTNALKRDPLSFLPITIHYDSANATATDRLKIFIEDERQNLTYTAGPVSSSATWQFCVNGRTNQIGRLLYANTQYFNGPMANAAYVDGQLVDPSSFGIRNPITSQWRPKSKAAIRAAIAAGGGARNGWGLQGWFLPFDDVTSLTTLGYDRSQSDTDTTGNNWTANNISLTAGATYDSLTDTPTANFCTLNPLLPINILTNGYYPILPTDGALKVIGSSAPPANFQNGTQVIKFKTYYEMLVGTVGAGTFYIGIQDPKTGTGYFYLQDGAKNLAGVSSAYGAAYTAGDRVAVCVDPVNRTLEFFKQTGGAGAFVSQGVIATAFPSGDYVPFFYASNGTALTVNFGQQGFANASLPSGALALNTKNLPIPTNGAVIKPSTAFVAVTDSGANVQTTLAAARPGWSDYIEIFKRRDASEGWRWRFSDDLANYLDSSSTAAKAAFPALSGTSYVGYAIKVAAANGVATGRLTHVNGVADTVTDGLGNTRKAIILKNEATGDWYFYHPDLTAGKLLYLNTTAAETTDATLGTVLANSFVVAAALASGTYRWVAFAEVDGFLKLFKHIGNASTDGPFDNLGLSANLSTAKLASAAGADWIVLDQARNPYNVMNTVVRFNTTAADDSSNPRIDSNSNGIKIRAPAATEPNQGSAAYVGMSIAAFPFRYANAR